MSIGLNIRDLRETNRLTRKELADIAGVSVKSISAYENGTRIPRMHVIERMARYFQIPNSAIVDNTPETDNDL